MKRIYKFILFLLVLTGCLIASFAFQSVTYAGNSELRIGVISYWASDSKDWDTLPPNSIVLINPDSGILKHDSEKEIVPDIVDWQKLLTKLKVDFKKRNITVLGYVPTGYFDHRSYQKDCQCEPVARITLQVQKYYELMPLLDGIFFDETAPKEELEKTADFNKEYALLRSINSAKRKTVFNVGTPSAKAVEATQKGEHLVLYEDSPNGYNDEEIASITKQARKKKIIVWHLLHSVKSEADMCKYVDLMSQRGVNYGFVTNWMEKNNPEKIISDPETWDASPLYWNDELIKFSSKKCPVK